MSPPDPLEERVRETLAARAEGVEATPALWERTKREAVRRRRQQLVSVVALGAAAIVLLAVAVATNLGGPLFPEIAPASPGEDAAPADGSGGVATGSTTWSVDVDGEFDNANVTINGYLPSDLVVRPGDTVEFVFQPGEVHTVTFGTLVDAALAAGPGGPEGPSQEFEALPDALTEDGEPVATGLAPCYSDDPPDDGSACEQQEQPEFRGDLALYSSGVLQPGSTFTMEIAEDIAPGEYGYLCLVHGFPMAGTVTVVEPGEDVRTPEEVEARKDQTLQNLTDQMQNSVSTLEDGNLDSFYERNDTFTDGADATVIAGGFGGPRSYLIEIQQFGPAEVEIEVGQTVRWHFQNGGHTISFNPTPEATPYIVTGDDGLPTVNEQAVTAHGGATPIPPTAALLPEDTAPDALPPATVIDGGEWDGQGFFSSGIAPAFLPVSYDITFTEPGTYDYQSLTHPGMTGTITVTD
jgi:plastocyanin